MLYFIFVFSLLALTWISLFTGAKQIRISELFSDGNALLFFLVSRVPRTLSLILTGAGLAVSGFIMQQLSQNKFVSPTTAGALDAAKIGILFGLIAFPAASLLTRMVFAMLFTFSASMVFMLIVKKVKFKNAVYIPLIGIMFGNIIGAAGTFFAYRYDIVQNTTDWLLGDFSSVMEGQYEAVYLILPAVFIAYVYADRFTIAGMGETFSKNLGLSYKSVVNIGLMAVALVVGASVVTVGSIPFVGLIIPNVVSMFAGDNLRRSLPHTALTGALFLLLCDIAGRWMIAPYEIPIGMMVGVIGGIFFIVLIARRDK